MADYSLTTMVVVPVSLTTPVVAGSTQDLTAGSVGFYGPDYVAATAANIAADAYFYVAQGRDNTYLQGTKRSDKIAKADVTEFYKVVGNPTPLNQVIEMSDWNVKPDDIVTVTLRGHSSFLSVTHFNGYTKSITVHAPCSAEGADPTVNTPVEAFVDLLIAEFNSQGTNSIIPNNIKITDFYVFSKSGSGENTKLVITGKPVTKYGQPCDIAANPHEYDRLWFNAFAYAGPETTADFIVEDRCEKVAVTAITVDSTYATGTSEEIAQLEKNYHSYQAGYLKHLYRTAGYNANFESHVTPGTTYTTYYIKFNSLDKTEQNWNANLAMDSSVVISIKTADSADFEAILVAALGAITVY